LFYSKISKRFCFLFWVYYLFCPVWAEAKIYWTKAKFHWAEFFFIQGLLKFNCKTFNKITFIFYILFDWCTQVTLTRTYEYTHREQVWVFDLYDRDTQDVLFDACTLLKIIYKYCRDKTVVYSNCWRAYNHVQNLGFYQFLNH
jgi:hypothetical protein